MKKQKRYTVQKRPVAVFLALCLGIAGVAGRTAYLQTGPQAAAAAGAGEKYVNVGVSRGFIYDRYLTPLVNAERENVAAIILTDATRALLPGGDSMENLRQNGVLVTVKTNAPVPETPVSVNVQTFLRCGEALLCPHVIGYTDVDGRGVCGIEKSFDRLLNDAAGRIGVKYTVNGRGAALAGAGIEVVNEGYMNPAGIVLTLDARAQKIAEGALKSSSIRKGAAVVVEAATGAVLAMASVPAFDVRNLAASLQNEDRPFLNRALAAYPVGSVFKPFIAAAALEHGVDCPADYDCAGQTDVSGVTFRCYRSVSHGSVDLAKATAKSCNCYFIALGQKTGAGAVTETCARFGFGKDLRLTGDLGSAAGNLPDETALSTPAALANLSFGQGELLASPLQMAAAYAALANGGVYRAPYITKALVDETGSEYAYYKNETEYRAATQETCAAVGACLMQNMQEGTGKNGASPLFAAAGKTATAQTGERGADGIERLCTWFCGYFPYEAPRYAVVVFNEDGSTAAEDCAPVFRAVTEGLYRAGL